MLPLMARADMPYVAMHWRGHAVGMQANAVHDDVVTDVVDELRLRIDVASEAGIRPGRLIIDPGLGFAKESGHNWELLGRLGDIVALGRPVLVGASRTSFLGRLPADPVTGQPRPVRLRDAATTAVSVLAAAQGAWCLRVHDVASTLDAVRVTARWGAEATASVRSLGSFEAQPGQPIRRLISAAPLSSTGASSWMRSSVKRYAGPEALKAATTSPSRARIGAATACSPISSSSRVTAYPRSRASARFFSSFVLTVSVCGVSFRIPDTVSTSARSCAGRWASRTLPLDVACTGVS